jgi:hypothetical protein
VDTEDFNLKGAAAVLVAVVVVLLGSAMFLGGQTSSILSNVGSAIDCCPEGGTVGAPVDGGQAAPPDEGKSIADADARPPELLIIRTGSLEMEVADLDAAVAAAQARVIAVGGYVSASDESASGEPAAATASAVYRIPADRWDEALEGIRDLASVIRHVEVGTEAVTSQVVDLGARIANLRASEAALQAIMAKATRIADVLAVQGELSTVRGEIEQLVAEKAMLEERAAFGTLTVAFNLPATPVAEEVRQGWNPATDVDQAAGTLIGAGQGLVSVAIWLGIVGLPLALTSAVVGLLGLRLFRLLVRRLTAEAEPG